MSAASPVITSNDKLRIFISYSSQDCSLANSIATALSKALGEFFCDVNLDKWFMELGREFRPQLQEKLRESDVLIVLYTGTNKSYTGWEIGFFEGYAAEEIAAGRKKIISLFLGSPPESIAGYEGINIEIPHQLLGLPEEEFLDKDRITSQDRFCRLVEDWQDTVNEYRKRANHSKLRDNWDPVETYRNIRLAVFRYSKSTVAEISKRQKQITVRVTGPLGPHDTDLPGSAVVIPVGKDPGAMSIFGLPEKEMTWAEFLATVTGSERDAWRDAISSVILSAARGENQVDNNQIVVSDFRSVQGQPSAYRLILTTVTVYFDNSRDFNLYFVQTLNRGEYGDPSTTLLLKGLGIVCRYRFMFLEKSSKFSCYNLLLAGDEQVQDDAYELRRELDLMRKDAINAGLDRPAKWIPFIDPERLAEMAQYYRPAEVEIRKLITEILQAEDLEHMNTLKRQLADTVRQLADKTAPINADLIRAMSTALASLIDVDNTDVKPYRVLQMAAAS